MTVRRVVTIDAALVADIAKCICAQDYHCYDLGKIESALHSAFYPGSYPFVHGGIATIAGAIAFYVTKAHAFKDGNKRAALVAATTFMALNGHDLVYPFDPATGHNDLADAIEGCAQLLSKIRPARLPAAPVQDHRHRLARRQRRALHPSHPP